jgi:hypothetical protein
MNNRNDTQSKSDTDTKKSEPNTFVWGTVWEPSQALVDKYRMKHEKYIKWLEDYRQSHNGAEPPPPKLISLPVKCFGEDEDGSDQNDQTFTEYRKPQDEPVKFTLPLMDLEAPVTEDKEKINLSEHHSAFFQPDQSTETQIETPESNHSDSLKFMQN